MLDLVLGLHLLSQHTPARYGDNNQNFGVYARTADGWAGGIYNNTYDRWSGYVAKTWLYDWPQYDTDVGLTVGAVTGYKKRRIEVPCEVYQPNAHSWDTCYQIQGTSTHNVSLMLAPSARYNIFRLSYVPKIGDKASVYHLSVENKF